MKASHLRIPFCSANKVSKGFIARLATLLVLLWVWALSYLCLILNYLLNDILILNIHKINKSFIINHGFQLHIWLYHVYLRDMIY